MRVDQLEVVPGQDAMVPGGRFPFRWVHDELGLGVLVEAAHRERLLALLRGRLGLQLGQQLAALGPVARHRAAGPVQQLAHVGPDVPQAEQLEEGLGHGQVHQAVVLDALGQEHSQKVEEFGDPVQLLGVLRERSREQSAGTLHVKTWRLQTAAQVHLKPAELVSVTPTFMSVPRKSLYSVEFFSFTKIFTGFYFIYQRLDFI